MPVRRDGIVCREIHYVGFPGGSEGKESACNYGDLGLIPGLGRFPGEGNGCLLQYSCLGNPMERGAWWATIHGVKRFGHDLATKPPSLPHLLHVNLCEFI